MKKTVIKFKRKDKIQINNYEDLKRERNNGNLILINSQKNFSKQIQAWLKCNDNFFMDKTGHNTTKHNVLLNFALNFNDGSESYKFVYQWLKTYYEIEENHIGNIKKQTDRVCFKTKGNIVQIKDKETDLVLEQWKIKEEKVRVIEENKAMFFNTIKSLFKLFKEKKELKFKVEENKEFLLCKIDNNIIRIDFKMFFNIFSSYIPNKDVYYLDQSILKTSYCDFECSHEEKEVEKELLDNRNLEQKEKELREKKTKVIKENNKKIIKKEKKKVSFWEKVINRLIDFDELVYRFLVEIIYKSNKI